MNDDEAVSYHSAPYLGGSQRRRDPELWAALIGRDDRRRQQAVRTIQALEQDRWYAASMLDTIVGLYDWQRPGVGDALALLGDPRFSPPYYFSEMIPIPAGSTTVGSAEFPVEQPVHQVEIGAFSLAQHPVTNAAYAAFVAATGHRRPSHWARSGPPKSLRNAPVVWVSARDAEDYCCWLKAETGFRYRLPTEAEWMAAARGQRDARRYPWGDEYRPECANIWTEPASARLCAVGMFPAGSGPFEHLDLIGNVWEWCSSLFWPYPYRVDDGREDPGAQEEQRVMLGGSWRSRRVSARCSTRQGELPTDRFEVVGFRLARDR